MKFNIEFTTEQPENSGGYIYLGKNNFVGNIAYLAEKDLWNALPGYMNNAFDKKTFAARSVLETSEIVKFAKFINEEVKA